MNDFGICLIDGCFSMLTFVLLYCLAVIFVFRDAVDAVGPSNFTGMYQVWL